MDYPDNHHPDGAAGARGRAVILPPEPDDAQADAALVPLRWRFDR